MSANKDQDTQKPIYFDNAATTAVDPRVLESMIPWFLDLYGNPSSLHHFGTNAKAATETARALIAGAMGASPDELFFTSGGTEANNWALKGVAGAINRKERHIIVSAIEHDCILNTCHQLQNEGYTISLLPVDACGMTNPDDLQRLIRSETILVSVMHANNEIGTIQPIREIGKICREKKVLFHVDACQSFGKIPLHVGEDCVDLLTVNAHKMYGPKGIGALFFRKGVPVVPLLMGGGQEMGMRSTTENTPGIIGFAKAVELCEGEMGKEYQRLTQLRDWLGGQLSATYPDFYLLGHAVKRLPGHLSFSFHGLEGEMIRLLLILDGLGAAVSTGSACSSNSGSPGSSHVLRAIGLNPFEARGAVRISLGRFNTHDEGEQFMTYMAGAIGQLNPIFSHQEQRVPAFI
jgi:cysteine desulfurase